MTKRVPYRRVLGPYGTSHWEPLNLTGRWMLKSGPYYDNQLFVEHKGLLFRSWVDEDDIQFRRAEEEHVFTCDRS